MQGSQRGDNQLPFQPVVHADLDRVLGRAGAPLRQLRPRARLKVQYLVGVAQKHHAVFGEAHGAGAARKERAAQLVLERLYLVAHRGLGHVQVLRRPREAQGGRDLGEARKLHAVHRPLPPLIV